MSEKSVKGNTFLKNDEQKFQNKSTIKNMKKAHHLYIVISDPDEDGNVLVVSINTLRRESRQDKSCVLDRNDHDFIKNKSIVRYDKVVIVSQILLVKMSLKGLIVMKEDLRKAVLKRIQKGAKMTKMIRKKFKEYYQYF